MAWFKVDDGFYSSRKVLSIPRSRRFEALGLWTACGSWTMKELTDGFVPREIVDELGGTQAQINDLLAAKLWTESEKGFTFWDWEDYQPSASSIKMNRKETSQKRSAAGRLGAQTRWQKHGKNNGKRDLPSSKTEKTTDLLSETKVDESTTTTQNMAKWQSDSKADGKRIAPTQPNQLKDKLLAQKNDGKNSKSISIPSSWKPNESHTEFAKTNSLNVDHEAEQFRNHALATGRKMKNWDAAFRVWLGNAVKWKKPEQKKPVADDWMNA